MYIADALSHAYLKTTDGAQRELCEIRALETVDHKWHIPVEPPKRDVFCEQIAADADIQELTVLSSKGGPTRKSAPCCPTVLC